MNSKGNLLLVPSGGLANRMRSIVSGHVLAKNIRSDLQVIWFKDWGLNAMFGEIFEPLELIPLREATFIDKLLYEQLYGFWRVSQKHLQRDFHACQRSQRHDK